MVNRSNIFVMIVWITLISIFIATLFAEASAKEVEDINNVTVQESPVQNSPKQKQHIDPFTIAIIGLSLGCMLIASSVHWNMTQRREIEAQISGLDSFLASNCAVAFHVNGCTDNDPMVSSVKDIQNSRDMKLKKYEENKNIMLRNISDIEAEIMRILG